MINEKKQHVPLGGLTALVGTWTKSLESGTQQLKMAKSTNAETAIVVAEITPPVPAHRDPWCGQTIKSVEFSGVNATVIPTSMDIYIYRTKKGDAGGVTPVITAETVNKPTEVGEYTLKGVVTQTQVDDGDTKYYAVYKAACGSTCETDIRSVVATFEEIDDSRM